MGRGSGLCAGGAWHFSSAGSPGGRKGIGMLCLQRISIRCHAKNVLRHSNDSVTAVLFVFLCFRNLQQNTPRVVFSGLLLSSECMSIGKCSGPSRA